MNNQTRKGAFAANALLDAGAAFGFYRTGHGVTTRCEACLALAAIRAAALFLPARLWKK